MAKEDEKIKYGENGKAKKENKEKRKKTKKTLGQRTENDGKRRKHGQNDETRWKTMKNAEKRSDKRIKNH